MPAEATGRPRGGQSPEREDDRFAQRRLSRSKAAHSTPSSLRTVTIATYSEKKNIENFIPEYSVK